MLITFKSKAAADVLMYATHAKPILDLLGKDVGRGVITAGETGEAIRHIEAEIVRRKQADAVQEAAANEQNDDRDADPRGLTTSVSRRAAFPCWKCCAPPIATKSL